MSYYLKCESNPEGKWGQGPIYVDDAGVEHCTNQCKTCGCRCGPWVCDHSTPYIDVMPEWHPIHKYTGTNYSEFFESLKTDPEFYELSKRAFYNQITRLIPDMKYEDVVYKPHWEED